MFNQLKYKVEVEVFLLSDQEHTACELVQRELTEELRRPSLHESSMTDGPS